MHITITITTTVATIVFSMLKMTSWLTSFQESATREDGATPDVAAVWQDDMEGPRAGHKMWQPGCHLQNGSLSCRRSLAVSSMCCVSSGDYFGHLLCLRLCSASWVLLAVVVVTGCCSCFVSIGYGNHVMASLVLPGRSFKHFKCCIVCSICLPC